MKKFNYHSLSHAIIISGDDVMKKNEIINEFVKALNCEDANKPCNLCKSCVKTEKMINPDVFTLDLADKIIGVDEIRKIRKDCFTLPNESVRKIYIIKNGQNLNANSQNALLKILEEPPKYVCLIIECFDEKNLLETIISRCTIYRFNFTKIEFEENIVVFAKKLANAFIEDNELEFLELKSIKTKTEFLQVLTAFKIYLVDSLKESEFYEKISNDIKVHKSRKQIFKILDIIALIESKSEFNVTVVNMLCYLVTENYRTEEYFANDNRS